MPVTVFSLRGIPSNRRERIEAAVVAKPGCSITRDELVAFGRTELGGYKLPKAIVVLDAIPMTPNNKPDRRALAKAAAERGSALE